MSALVDYGSSDEEDVSSESPAQAASGTAAAVEAVQEEPRSIVTQQATPATSGTHNNHAVLSQPSPKDDQDVVSAPPSGPVSGPGLGPAAAPASPRGQHVADMEISSPYSYERQRLRELTMPRTPNFQIPDAPPPPENNSEEAAVLDATTKKFERFLALKKQGVHFNDRLSRHPAMGNPNFTANLLSVAGIDNEESYASSLPAEVAVRTKWPEECYAEKLLWQNDRREKKRLNERGKLDFVPAVKKQA